MNTIFNPLSRCGLITGGKRTQLTPEEIDFG